MASNFVKQIGTIYNFKSSNHGTAVHQAGLDRYAAIQINSARDIRFEKCIFRNIGMSAVEFGAGVRDSGIWSSRFEDIGANAVRVRGDKLINNANTRDISILTITFRYGWVKFGAVGLLSPIRCEHQSFVQHNS